MKGNAIPLCAFIEGNKTQYVIPVYQRNYDWLIGNCDQLLSDLRKMDVSKHQTHFFGSIVTAMADGYGNNRLVIDGQQRITTVSLLLLAAIKAVKDEKLPIIHSERVDEAYEVFLKAKFCSSPRKIKLVPIDNDIEAYDRIFNEEEPLIEGSKMTRNYMYFYDKLTQGQPALTFDRLLDAIEGLQIISIELDTNDDAQLIFESLNSTGLALSEADKIRNYLLMSFSLEEQKDCYERYWHKIEEMTDMQPTMFLRDYLTIMQQLQRHVRLNKLYPEWKGYMEKKDRKEELAKMLAYSEYYRKVTTCQLPTKKLSTKLKHINNNETDIANVFFIQFLKYADDNKLDEKEVYTVMDLIENFMARRIVCGVPANSLTQVFCALHKDVLKSIGEYEKEGEPTSFSYSDILTYHLLRRINNFRLPDDEDFMSFILTRDVYHMPKPARVFLFERLENSAGGEYNDVASDMKAGDATIEHIMPQKLTPEWMAMLGKDYANIQARYQHTFSNLTLTGINSKLGNKPFLVKRDGIHTATSVEPGYKDSKYRLTRSVSDCDKWTEEELIARGNEMVETFLRLYPMPKTTFKPLSKSLEEVSLEDDSFDPTNRLLKGFRLFGVDYAEETWKNMMLRVISIVTEKHPDEMDALYDAGQYFYTEKNADPKYCTLISHNRYVWTSMDNRSKLKCLHIMFDKCGIAEGELILLMENGKQA